MVLKSRTVGETIDEYKSPVKIKSVVVSSKDRNNQIVIKVHELFLMNSVSSEILTIKHFQEKSINFACSSSVFHLSV